MKKVNDAEEISFFLTDVLLLTGREKNAIMYLYADLRGTPPIIARILPLAFWMRQNKILTCTPPSVPPKRIARISRNSMHAMRKNICFRFNKIQGDFLWFGAPSA
jgi:hypothetical protein